MPDLHMAATPCETCGGPTLFAGTGRYCRGHADGGHPWSPPPAKPRQRSVPRHTPPPAPTEAPAGYTRFLVEAGTEAAWRRVAPPIRAATTVKQRDRPRLEADAPASRTSGGAT